MRSERRNNHRKVDAAEQEADFITKLLVLQLFCHLKRNYWDGNSES